VLGEEASLGAAAHTANLDHEAADKAVLALNAAGLLVAGDPPTFAGPLVASAVAATIPDAERGALHERAAEALRVLRRPLERIAPHLLRTRPAGDDWTVAVLWPAGVRAVEAGRAGLGVAYLRRALAEPAPADVRADLLIDLGTAEAVAGEPSALDHLSEAASLHRSRARRAAALLEAGRVLTNAGRTREAAAVVDRAHAQNPPGPRLRAALDAARLAAAQLDPGRRKLALTPDTPLADLDLGAPEQRSLAAYGALERVLRLDDVASARAVAEAVAAAVPQERLGEEADTLAAAAAALAWLGEARRAEAILGPSLDVCRRRAAAATCATAYVRRSLARLLAGDVVGAAADAGAALEASETGWMRYRPLAIGALVVARLERGELHEAAALLEEDPRARWSESVFATFVCAARGQLELALGRPADALGTFQHAGALAADVGIVNPVAVPWRAGAAIALGQLGETERAARQVREALALADEHDLPIVRGRARRVAGLISGGRDGIPLLEQATHDLEHSDARLEHAVALVELGVALLSSGNRRSARQRLEAGLDLADACGATRLAVRAAAELDRAGVRHARARGSAALTPSEARVVELAVTGLTNRQIAEQLFVSVKAVEWHLGNVYAKLGVSRRQELADALATLG
jgi:DNA-binding CsgD family transcriptional regulator